MELDQEHAGRIVLLEARMNRMEAWMQEVLVGQGIQSAGTAGINPVAVPPQERPEIGAIREALLAGDKIKAMKLYRSHYGVSMKEALDSLNAM